MSQPFGTYTPGTINVRLGSRPPSFGGGTPTAEEWNALNRGDFSPAAPAPAGWSTGSASPVKTTPSTASTSKTPYLIAGVVLAGFGIWLATKS